MHANHETSKHMLNSFKLCPRKRPSWWYTASSPHFGTASLRRSIRDVPSPAGPIAQRSERKRIRQPCWRNCSDFMCLIYVRFMLDLIFELWFIEHCWCLKCRLPVSIIVALGLSSLISCVGHAGTMCLHLGTTSSQNLTKISNIFPQMNTSKKPLLHQHVVPDLNNLAMTWLPFLQAQVSKRFCGSNCSNPSKTDFDKSLIFLSVDGIPRTSKYTTCIYQRM